MSATAIAPLVRGTVRPRPAGERMARDGARDRGAAPIASRGVGRCAPSPAPLRLTRRGRAVVWVLGIALAGGVGGAAASAQADGPVAATEVRRVEVAPGQTLWGIAADVAAPGEDVRDVVLELMALNELPSAGLQAGQRIVVPVG
ncbi:LysM peptidoglycan-binding domain-containing protein [Cellulomonas xiejunii]|uniref:LysM peptidoglycan-binding domain-containing protein n=1 Tax=Cellulomonas xiejunii TaxID=2968083 RepID=A0ABY5KUB0_9CELL|nr:LysM peptidoglycan-binding domain-containing protein [Cellulomonas xiejunii]UUI73320.1 LysM peptidoglycan-binding domain-containing protein [Cellulomonas xiejunii]